MLGATLAGLGIQRSGGAAYRPVWTPAGPFWKRWWYMLRPPAPPVDYVPVGPPAWAGPPESEIGAAVPVREVLHSSQDLVIALTDLSAYSNGFEFRIAVRSRTSIDARFFGFGPHPTTEVITIEVRLADGRVGRGATSGHGDELMDHYRGAREGRVTLRYLSRLRHFHVSYKRRGQPVMLLVAGAHVRVIAEDGALLRELTLDPARDYQRSTRPTLVRHQVRQRSAST